MTAEKWRRYYKRRQQHGRVAWQQHGKQHPTPLVFELKKSSGWYHTLENLYQQVADNADGLYEQAVQVAKLWRRLPLQNDVSWETVRKKAAMALEDNATLTERMEFAACVAGDQMLRHMAEDTALFEDADHAYDHQQPRMCGDVKQKPHLRVAVYKVQRQMSVKYRILMQLSLRFRDVPDAVRLLQGAFLGAPVVPTQRECQEDFSVNGDLFSPTARDDAGVDGCRFHQDSVWDDAANILVSFAPDGFGGEWVAADLSPEYLSSTSSDLLSKRQQASTGIQKVYSNMCAHVWILDPAQGAFMHGWFAE